MVLLFSRPRCVHTLMTPLCSFTCLPVAGFPGRMWAPGGQEWACFGPHRACTQVLQGGIYACLKEGPFPPHPKASGSSAPIPHPPLPPHFSHLRLLHTPTFPSALTLHPPQEGTTASLAQPSVTLADNRSQIYSRSEATQILTEQYRPLGHSLTSGVTLGTLQNTA